jgi:hypothetical protein
MDGTRTPGELASSATLAVLEFLCFSGAADVPEGRDLWLDCLSSCMLLIRFTASHQSTMRRSHRASLRRLLDSLVNLVCSLAWIDSGYRDRIVSDLESIHEALGVS